MSFESRLLSKVIDENNISQLSKYNVTASDFYQQREAFKFIKDYTNKYGQVPAYTEVVAECPDFDYLPEVPDNVAYMCNRIKSDNAKRKAYELLQKDAGEKFGVMNGKDFVNWLYEQTSMIKEATNVDIVHGTNWGTNGDERWDMYEESKETRTYSYVPTPYPTLTEWLGGGFELGDYVLVQAGTNVGKSWIASDIGVTAFKNGFGVIHYSPELSKKQQLQRLDTLCGKFTNSDLKIGELNARQEAKYKEYLEQFNEANETPYIVKTMGDMPKGLSLDVIESDLQANENIKLVIIDGFNLMNHRGNDGTRNNMTKTSRRLRQLFAKYSVVGIVVHQISMTTMKENRITDESGMRTPTPARIDQSVSETSACIQDACTILNFDRVDSSGKLLLAKARTPHVGNELGMNVDFNNGMIREGSVVDFF